MKIRLLAAVAASSLLAQAASAAPTVDGSLTPAEYAGALVTSVLQAPGVDPATQGPGNPGPFVENVTYTVYYTSDTNFVYVGVQSTGSSGALFFANLYFDNNNSVSPGSDIGFEVLNNRAFKPGVPGYSAVSLTSIGGAYAGSQTATADTIEVKIPWTAFTTDVFGLGESLLTPGGALQLRTNQTFNYAGATGDGVDAGLIPRFGFQSSPSTSAVPEAGTWAMMIAGLGLSGAALRRRRTRVAFA